MNKALAVLILLLAVVSPLQARGILIFGDSWAEPMAPALRFVLDQHGHMDVAVEATDFWGLAARLSSSEGLAYITEQIGKRPDVDIIHLSIGHNDVHCLLVNDSCTFNWNPSMANTAEEEDILNTIIADTETIVDHIASIRPGAKIFLQSYDYMRPRDDIPHRGNPTENNAVHTKWAELAEGLASKKPALTFLNLMGLMQVIYGFDGVQHTVFDPASPIPPGDPSLPDPTLPGPAEAFNFNDIIHLNPPAYRRFAEAQYDEYYGPLLDGETFQINAGLNDAWYNLATPGQGLLIATYPVQGSMFVAWFTFDTERPPIGITALLGEPGHRWITAQGPYSGDTADLTIYLTEGGVFDEAEPSPETDQGGFGTMTIEFADCNAGLVTYDIPSLTLAGEIPIERVVPDNVSLCEELASQ